MTANRPFLGFMAAIGLATLVTLEGSWSTTAAAADKYSPGDEIEVYFLNKWWPATVAEVGKRGEVLADYEFAGQMQRKVFKDQEVRGAFEAGAMAPARFWADQSGKFRIRAALIGVDDTSITLRKPDKTEVKVTIDKLSQGDQDFLKKFRKVVAKNVASQGTPPPPLEEFSSADGTDAWALWGADDGKHSSAIEPDPVPNYLKLKQGGVAFTMPDFFDQLGAVLPLGGTDAWILAGVESGKPGGGLPTRVVWVSLVKQKVERILALAPGEIVLDYHPTSRMLLTQSQATSEADSLGFPVLTLWKTSPNEAEVTGIVRWKATGENNRSVTPWGRIIDSDTVLHRSGGHDFVAWDIPGKKAKYQLKQEAFFAPTPTISGGRKYLAMPEDKGLRVIEAATGKLRAFFPSSDGVAGAAFTEDGQRLAFVGRGRLYLCNLSSPQSAPEEIQAEAIGTPFNTTLEWLDSDRLIADALGGNNKVLFSLKHRLALWNYEFDFNAVRNEPGRRFRQVLDGHLVYAATVQNGANRGLAVGAVKLPGPKVDSADSSLDPESLMIIKRGTAMKVNIQAGGFNDRVWEAVKQIMTRNGWTYDANAPILLTAEMKQGEAHQVTYRSFGGVGGGNQTATVQPFISNLKIETNGKVAWSSGTSTGAPPFMRLEAGQTVQGEINRWQNPDVEFFDRVVVPERILDPDKRSGLGTTQVTNRGLVPK